MAETSDPECWVAEHGDALYRYARSRVGHRASAEDLVQETFLAALRSREGFQGRSAPRTWLVAILRRKIADHYRRRESDPTIQADSEADEIPARYFSEGFWRTAPGRWRTPPEVAENRELRAALETCQERLPESLAIPFALRELDRVAPLEISRVLGISPGTLRVRLHRARLVLRDCLERRWFSPTRGHESGTS